MIYEQSSHDKENVNTLQSSHRSNHTKSEETMSFENRRKQAKAPPTMASIEPVVSGNKHQFKRTGAESVPHSQKTTLQHSEPKQPTYYQVRRNQEISQKGRNGLLLKNDNLGSKNLSPRALAPTQGDPIREVRKTDFKLLLKVLKGWRKQVGQRRARKAEADRQMENWVLSIHFYNQSLLTKGLLSLKHAKSLHFGYQNQVLLVSSEHEHRVRIAHFKAWLKLTCKRKERKENLYKALNHWGLKGQTKVLRAFKIYLKVRAQQRSDAFDSLSRKPSAIFSALLFSQTWTGQPLVWKTFEELGRLLPKRGQTEATLGCLRKFYLKQALTFLKTQAVRERQKSQRIKSHFKRTLFRLWAQVAQKQEITKLTGEEILNNRINKIKRNLLQNWAMKTKKKTKKRNRIEQAKYIHRLIVLRKCMDSLIKFYVTNRTQKTNLVMSVNTTFNRLISKSFEGWKFLAAFNAQKRQTIKIVRLVQNKRIEKSYLKQWHKAAQSSARATSLRRAVLLRKVFLAYQQYIQSKEIEVNRRQFCREKHHKNLLSTSFGVIKKNMQLCRMERQLKITVFRQMEIYRMQQIVRNWREQSFILQAKKAQREFSQAFFDQKISINSFRALKYYYLKKKELKNACHLILQRNHLNLSRAAFTGMLLYAYTRKDLKIKKQQIEERRLLGNKMHYFVLWSEILRSFYQRRMDKIVDSDRKVLRLAFQSFQQHWARCRQMRQDLRVFFTKQQLMLCAQSLEAWKGFTVVNEEKRRKRRVAQLHFIQGVLEKTWNAYKRHHKVCQAGKKAKAMVKRRVERQKFAIWKEEFSLNQRASKFRASKLARVQRRSFSNWKKFSQLHQVHALIRNKGLHRYACQLEEKAFKAFLLFTRYRNERKDAMWRAEHAHYRPRFARTVLLHWRYQVQLEASLKSRLEDFQKEKAAKRVWSCFMCLKMISEKSGWEKRRFTPFRNNLRRRLLRKCLLSFFEHVAKNKILRYLSQQLAEKRRFGQITSALAQLQLQRETSLARRALSESAFIFRARTLQKSAFYSLCQHKLRSQYNTQVRLHFEQKRREKCFYEWIQAYNDCRGELPLMALGDQFYLRKQFVRFVQKLDEVRSVQLMQAHFQRKSLQFRINKQKVEGLRKLFNFSQQKILEETKIALSEKFYLRKVFKAWLQEHIRMLQALNQDETVVENPLGRRMEFKIHAVAKQAIEQNRILRLTYACMQVLKSLLVIRQEKKKKLTKLTQKHCLSSQQAAFYQWKQDQTYARMVLKAETFHKTRSRARIQLLGWEMWVIVHKQKQNNKALKLLAEEFRRKELFGVAFNGFFMNRERQQVKSQKSQIAQLFNAISILKLAFASLKMGCEQVGQENELKRLAQSCSNTRLIRNCFQGWLQHKARSQKGKLVAAKRAVTTLQDKMQIWLKVYRASVILGKMVSNLAKTDAQMSQSLFLSQLQALSHEKRARQQLKDTQFARVAHGFFAQIRQRISHKKLVRLSLQKQAQKAKRRTLLMLLQRVAQEEHRSLVLNQKLEVFLAEKIQMKLNFLFIQFQNLLLTRRIKDVCWNKYKSHVRNRALKAWKTFVIQEKLTQHSTKTIQAMQRIRYFRLWQSSIEAQQQTEQAKDLLSLKQLHSLFLAWRQVVLKMKAVKRTRQKYETSQTRTLEAFHCWLDFVQAQKYFRQVSDTIRAKRRVNLQKLGLLALQQTLSLKKIQKNLKGYYHLKLQKSIVTAWNAITKRNNSSRIQTTKIRAQIMHNPEYARPLLVLRNLTLFKAFNSLASHTEAQKQDQERDLLSLNTFYLRTIKKAFFSLKIVAESKRRKRQSRQLHQMLTQKRCLNALKALADKTRAEKKKKIDSTVFNFLNLERKAYHSLMIYCNERQQSRIKEEFAAKLRNKRIMDIAFLAFRFNKEITSSGSFLVQDKSANQSRLNQSQVVILEAEKSIVLGEISQNAVMIPSPKHKRLQSHIKANPSISRVEDLDEVNQPSLTQTFIEQSRSSQRNKTKSRTSNYETGHFGENKENIRKEADKSFINEKTLSDLSMLQEEMSRIEDVEEKYKIARLIYQNRLLFNCFSSLSCYLYEEGDSQIIEEESKVDLTLDLSANVYCDELTYSKMGDSNSKYNPQQDAISIANSKMRQGSSNKVKHSRHSQLSGILMREDEEDEVDQSEIEGVFDSVILGLDLSRQQ